MTIICASASEGVMGADTMLVDNRPGTRFKLGNTPKIVKAPDGVLAGAAGHSGMCSEFLRWVEEGRGWEIPGRWFTEKTGIEALLLLPDRTMLYYASPRPDKLLDDFTAIGVGAPLAQAARYMKGSVLDCVKAAMHVSTECGGEATILRLGKAR